MLRPLGLVAVGFGAVFLPLLMGWRDVPYFIPEALMLIGAVWATATAFRRRGEPGRWRTPVTAVLWCGLALYGFWVLSLSAYADASEAPAVGAAAPAIHAVRVTDGAPFHLAAQRDYETLLVFYRGPW